MPYDHVTDLLPLRITQHELFIYAADLECIARHELAPQGQGLKLDPLGFHKATRRPAIDWDQLRLAFERMGEHSKEFFRLLSSGPPRQWAHAARRILLLRQRYATDDIDQALGHAARFGAFSLEAIERIVESRHRPRTLDEYVAEETARRLEAELGTKRTEPRDLAEYDGLGLPAHCGRDVPSACGAPNQENDPCHHAANPESGKPPLTNVDEQTNPASQTPSSTSSSATSSSSDSDT